MHKTISERPGGGRYFTKFLVGGVQCMMNPTGSQVLEEKGVKKI